MKILVVVPYAIKKRGGEIDVRTFKQYHDCDTEEIGKQLTLETIKELRPEAILGEPIVELR